MLPFPKKIRPLPLSIYFLLLSNIAFAQFEAERMLIASTLDTPNYSDSIFADFYRIRTDDFTRGGSSLQVIENTNPLSGVTGGYFLPDDVTITFDYKFKDTSVKGFLTNEA